jgi:hypothetical protein
MMTILIHILIIQVGIQLFESVDAYFSYIPPFIIAPIPEFEDEEPTKPIRLGGQYLPDITTEDVKND